MFLKAVYRHSRLLCAVILLFFLLQLAVDYKRGVVFAPFFHYGMYSKPQHLGDTFAAWIVTHGADTLRGHDFSPAHWDKLVDIPARIEHWNCRYAFFQTEVSPLLQRLGISGAQSHKLLQPGSAGRPIFQHTQHLKRYFRFEDSLLVQKQWYVWRSSKLVAIGPAAEIDRVCH